MVNKSAMEVHCFREEEQQKCGQKVKVKISDHEIISEKITTE